MNFKIDLPERCGIIQDLERRVNEEVCVMKGNVKELVKNVTGLERASLMKVYPNLYEYLSKILINLVQYNCDYEILKKCMQGVVEEHSHAVEIQTLPDKSEHDAESKSSYPSSNISCVTTNKDDVSACNATPNDEKQIEGKKKIRRRRKASAKKIKKISETEISSDEQSRNAVLESDNQSFQDTEHHTIKLEEKEDENSTRNSSFTYSLASSPKVEEQKLKAIEETTLKVMESLIKPKIEDVCLVSCVFTPNEFYIHIVSEESSKVDMISDEIGAIASSLQGYSTKENVSQKSEYCFCYIDKMETWYRARILPEQCSEPDWLLIQLIDFGSKLKVPLKDIKRPIKRLLSIPVLAYKCKLASVRPIGNGGEHGDWTETAISHFKTLTNHGEIPLIINYIEEKEGIFIVDFKTEEILSLSYEMLNAGFAEMDGTVNLLTTETESEEHFRESCKKTEEKSFQDWASLETINYEIKLMDNTKFDEKSENNVIAVPVYTRAFRTIPLPDPFSQITLKVLYALDVRTFYAIILDPCDTGPIKSMKELVKLMNNPENVKRFESYDLLPSLSEIVLVPVEGKWHRGQVFDIKEFDNEVRVQLLLVDLGTYIEANLREIRKIQPLFLNLPFQATLCKLANIVAKPLTEEETEMMFNYYEAKTYGRTLQATTVNWSSVFNLILYTEDGKDVGKELVEVKLAERAPNCIIPEQYFDYLLD